MLIGAFAAFAAARHGAGPHAALLAAALRGPSRGRGLRALRGRGPGRSDPRRHRVEPRGGGRDRVLLPPPRRARRAPSSRSGRCRLVALRPSGSGPRGFSRSGRRGRLSRAHAPGPRARGRGREPARSRGDGRLGRRRAHGRLGRGGRARRPGRRPPRPHGVADVRRGCDGRTRLPRARARRLRALEAAAPRAGRAPRRRRHGPSVPPSGRRRRAIPYAVFLALPGLLALFALAAARGRGGAPKALGTPAP